MGKVIAPLAEGTVPEHTVFDRRFVVECCERFHIHWRNLRLELTADNWNEFVQTFEEAIATWRAHGSPREHPHLELGKYLMDLNEVVHPTTVGVELCENLYKQMRATHGQDAEFWEEDAFVHFHYRDLRFEMSIADFLAFSKTMSDARERLTQLVYRPVAGLFEQLNEHNILYVVLRNWEQLPDSVEVGPHSDLDLLVHPAHVAKLDELWTTERTHAEPYRVQRRVPVLGPRGEQTYLLTDVRTTGDGYMPEAFSHQLLTRRVPHRMFHVLPPREHFLSLLYHVVVHKGVMSADYAAKLATLARAAGIAWDPARSADHGRNLALLAEHGIEPVEPEDVSVLPHLPFVAPPETAISSRLLDVHQGRAYHSRVHVLGDRVLKQTSFDLAAREHALLSQLDGPRFPRVYSGTQLGGWTACELELVDGTPLGAAVLSDDMLPGFVSGLLDALGELAAAGIVHRDIRADNILVRDGLPVLIDFGWAVAPGLPHVTPNGLGDEGRAPEGFCDVYATGVVLASLADDFPQLAPLAEAMTRPDASARVTDLAALRRIELAVDDQAAQTLAERFAAPVSLHGVRGRAVLAFADELAADPRLLHDYAEAVGPDDDTTLVIYAPGADPEALEPLLLRALAAAGVAESACPDLLALATPSHPAAERGLAGAVHALHSARTPTAPFDRLPRFQLAA
ncbi:MAG TPA: hypothetical protein VFB25_08930 [Gaiellaceae bacterium]|nr:hypothetical protein [Gaiellaceae bacterium]